MAIDTIASALLSVVVGTASGYIATRLALRKYRYEQLWKRKHQAYMKVLSALHSIELAMRNIAVDQGQATGDAKQSYGKAVEDVVYAVNVARLILPTSAVDALEGFRAARWEITESQADLHERMSLLRKAALERRDEIVAIARRDLQTDG